LDEEQQQQKEWVARARACEQRVARRRLGLVARRRLGLVARRRAASSPLELSTSSGSLSFNDRTR
jgi:hypothetical protein